jgi:prealbumin domain-containing protein
VKTLPNVAALFLVAVSPGTLAACSMSACLGNGIELRQDFAVKVTHDDKPLSGAAVQITRNDGNSIVELFSRQTDVAGKVHISKLPPGNYWLSVDLLGIPAGGECFHVSPVSSRKAKKEISFEWGDEAPATRRAAGKLIDSQPGKSGEPLWNLTHRSEVPVGVAKLTLRSPFSEAVYTTVSDDEGHFEFGEIPDGLYVLHLEGGTSTAGPTSYSADLLFRLSGSAKQKALLLTERDAGGGSCGGWSLAPDYS